MATKKFNPFPLLKQPKGPVYEILYRLNQAFESIALEIEHLDDSEAIPIHTRQLYRDMAEELRAAMNHRITGILHAREAKDWYWFSKLRERHQKRYTV